MEFQSYHKNLINAIANDFTQAKSSCSSTSIHDFRVGIKRLRSFIGVLANIDGSVKVKENERKFNPVYKAAGKIRDIQVIEKMILDWTGNRRGNISEYYNFLKLSEQSAKKNFARVSRHKNAGLFTGLVEVFSRKLASFTPEFLERHVGRGVSAALQRVAAKKESNSIPPEELHGLRIDAKDARYRLQVLVSIRENNNDFKPVDKWLREIHRAIGEWHDLKVAEKKLEKFLSTDAVKPLFSPRAYEELKLELSARADKSYERFLTAWNDKENVLESAIDEMHKYDV